MDDFRERLGALTATVKAAHTRLDKVEVDVREDLKEINQELKTLSADINKGKGWTAALLALSGFVGAIIAQVIVFAVTQWGQS